MKNSQTSSPFRPQWHLPGQGAIHLGQESPAVSRQTAGKWEIVAGVIRPKQGVGGVRLIYKNP